MSFFVTYSPEDYEYLLTPAGYAALILFMIAALLVIMVFHRKKGIKMTTRELTFCAISMALALVTSFIKFGSLPFGGSITMFSMFFICFVGFLYGPSVGIMTGVAYGILQLIIEPYIYHPAQVLLDYPLAFGMLGLSGFFAGRKHGLSIGYIVGVIGRYICHVISGYIFFGSYAPEGMNAMVYTLGYNATYIVPEMVLTMVLLCIPAVVKALGKIRNMANATS